MLKNVFKKLLYFIVYYSGTLDLLIFILKRIKKSHFAVILFYHRFSPNSADGHCLPHLSIWDFQKQMRHIKKRYNVMTMDELAKKLTKKEEFSLPSVIITIDDGYLSGYTAAYPILKELNLPATIYLTTGIVGTNDGLWVDDLESMLLLSKEKSLSVNAILNGEVLDISHPRGKVEALEKLFNVLVHVQHQQKLVLMRELSAVLGVNGTCGVNRGRKMMNWDEVMEMRGREISFGAHTINHPTLSKMDLQEAKREISGSKEEIEKRLGCRQCHFAIPNGKEEDFNEELKKYCEEIGFKTIVSTEPGVVSTQSDLFFLRRIDLPPPIHVFAVTLARNIFFHRTK